MQCRGSLILLLIQYKAEENVYTACYVTSFARNQNVRNDIFCMIFLKNKVFILCFLLGYSPASVV
jgi:hypothetical protein